VAMAGSGLCHGRENDSGSRGCEVRASESQPRRMFITHIRSAVLFWYTAGKIPAVKGYVRCCLLEERLISGVGYYPLKSCGSMRRPSVGCLILAILKLQCAASGGLRSDGL
jgi:hypothetical protein